MNPHILGLKPRSIHCVLLTVIILSSLPLLAQDNSIAAAQAPDPETAQKLVLAEGYHDLTILYMKKGDLDKAFVEARQIAQLRLPPEFEKLVAQSLSIITEKFAEVRRFDLGQTLLDEALKNTELPADKVKILRNKARLFMLAGDNDKAIDSWRRALDIESRRGH
jgi:tetratricopeptide (TPR) repeat protein